MSYNDVDISIDVLIEALTTGQSHILRYLCENGLDVTHMWRPDCRNSTCSPLVYAVSAGRVEAVEILVKEGLCGNETDMLAARAGHAPVVG